MRDAMRRKATRPSVPLAPGSLCAMAVHPVDELLLGHRDAILPTRSSLTPNETAHRQIAVPMVRLSVGALHLELDSVALYHHFDVERLYFYLHGSILLWLGRYGAVWCAAAEVCDRRRFRTATDLARLPPPHLEVPFTNRTLAASGAMSAALAGVITYTLLHRRHRTGRPPQPRLPVRPHLREPPPVRARRCTKPRPDSNSCRE